MSGDDPGSDLRLAELALEVARAAGRLIRQRRDEGVTVAATKTSQTDIVTETDREVEVLIRSLLADARPDDGIVGEEGDDEPGATGVRWIVDPIDGTVNFLYGIPQYAVSVAAERDGVVVAGVVLDVARDTAYVGRRETGPDGQVTVTADRDGRPISVRSPAPLAQRLIGTGFSYEAGIRAIQADAVSRLLPRVRDIRRLGSCALDLCHVAEGLLDGYVEEGVNLWDFAAGVLIAEGAGARSELAPGAGGQELLVCAPAHGFEDFRKVVEQAGFLAISGE
ncbi:inositol monophosphatase family protein [Nocardioides sp.]|uniref:inositol monophosphatase family protein n=1 Tax=Nocardioides sp. TaxID=35761 RepID=UPI002D80D964|nr:inositol monophosphatase family protein [Nocardioides sp.]HET8959632.1 inositol monophosphatase family protein [Nocardioides sp.]